MGRRTEDEYMDMESFSPWEVYSDLYCGLLLVFVLLFFFAIYQYIDARETNDADTKQLQAEMREEQASVLALYRADLESQEAAYQEKSAALEERDAELSQLQVRLEERESELIQNNVLLAEKETRLAKQSSMLTEQETELAQQREQLSGQKEQLEEQAAILADQQTQLEEQAATLQDQKAQLETQEAALAGQQTKLQEQEEVLAEQSSELARQEELLAEKEMKLEERDREIEDRNRELTALQETVSRQEETLRSQQEAIESQAEQIEQIVGIRGELIRELQSKMSENGMQVEVDPDTGAIAFRSEILFELNSDVLKEDGKEFFRTFMPAYLSVLLQPAFSESIAEIMIEGHTDNAGSYLHNLELSQKRAYSVAQFILGEEGGFLDDKTRETLRSMLTVNGCADRSPVYREDGTIDEDRSRRVEIKFSLMDREMIQEMDRILHMDSAEGADIQESAANP